MYCDSYTDIEQFECRVSYDLTDEQLENIKNENLFRLQRYEIELKAWEDAIRSYESYVKAEIIAEKERELDLLKGGLIAQKEAELKKLKGEV
jgi:hypothetical protein